MEAVITEEMYLMAKKVVDAYEKKNDPRRYHHSHRLIDLNEIEYDKRWYESRKGKEVRYDWKSRNPTFIDYNTERLKIWEADQDGQNELITNLSTSTWNELEKDGYSISLVPEHQRTENGRCLIKW